MRLVCFSPPQLSSKGNNANAGIEYLTYKQLVLMA